MAGAVEGELSDDAPFFLGNQNHSSKALIAAGFNNPQETVVLFVPKSISVQSRLIFGRVF